MSAPVLKARSDLGNAVRRRDPEQIAEARRTLAAAKLEAYVSRVLAEAPPLTPAQSSRIASMLRGSSGRDAA